MVVGVICQHFKCCAIGLWSSTLATSCISTGYKPSLLTISLCNAGIKVKASVKLAFVLDVCPVNNSSVEYHILFQAVTFFLLFEDKLGCLHPHLLHFHTVDNIQLGFIPSCNMQVNVALHCSKVDHACCCHVPRDLCSQLGK